MARAMWKGAIAFGLVNIPVELYSATRDHRPKFRLLHAKDESPVRYERVCQTEGKPVALGRAGQGLRVRRRASSSSSRRTTSRPRRSRRRRPIDILDFVDPKEVDERYFETPYYLQPGKGADRAYALLREAIRDSGKIGIAKIILRDAQHLAARRSHRRRAGADDDALRRRARRPRRLPFPKADEIRPAELKMARQLVDSLSAKWEPEKYTDEYTRQPDAGHQREVEGQDAAAQGARDAAAGGSRRPDGAAAGQPRGDRGGRTARSAGDREEASSQRSARPTRRRKRVA